MSRGTRYDSKACDFRLYRYSWYDSRAVISLVLGAMCCAQALLTRSPALLRRQLCQVATEESAKELQMLYHAEKDLPGQNPYFDALYRARARALVQENDYCFKVEYVCDV